MFPLAAKLLSYYQLINFKETSLRLKRATLSSCDFETSLSTAKKGDFAFLDPPYTVAHNQNGFVKYNDSIFSWSDQTRLRDIVTKLKKRGVIVLILNANHQCVKDLYRGVGQIFEVNRISLLAGKGGKRGITSELAVRVNYE